MATPSCADEPCERPFSSLLNAVLAFIALLAIGSAVPLQATAAPHQAPAVDRDAGAGKNATQRRQPTHTQRRNAPSPMDPIVEREGLPRVLLIGDSISIGYTLPVRQLLKDEANVLRPPTNCGPTTRGLEQIDAWVGDGTWDVIHFNWGLHDLKYMGPAGENLADPSGSGSRQQVPLDQYRDNLERLVQRLEKTGAKLIWCTTTPVPPGAAGRVPSDVEQYNDAARQIMQRHGIAIDDLYAAALPRLKEIQLPANVHFAPQGSEVLAEHVAKSIREALQQNNATRSGN